MKTRLWLLVAFGIAACAPPAAGPREDAAAACNPRDPWSCREEGRFCVETGGSFACVANTCGNGIVEPPEECDGPDAVSCASYIGGEGSFTCGRDCRWDYSGCARCGNGLLNGLESCDGNRFADGVSCEAYGYSGGTIACLPSCRPDTRACFP